MLQTEESQSHHALPKTKPGWLRRLYNWVLSWADTPYGSPALFVLSFMESSFFPIPPDVLQIALSAEKPKRSFWYAGLSLVGSVLGALLGYYIGVVLWDAAHEFFYTYLFSREDFAWVAGDMAAGIDRADPQYAEQPAKMGWYHIYGFWAIFFASVTPFPPYKVFTIAAGVCRIAIPMFVIASVIGRGTRFFAVAALMFFFGPTIKVWIEKYFNLLAIILAVLLIGGLLLIKCVW